VALHLLCVGGAGTERQETIITARGTTPAGLQSAYELSFEAVSFITHHQSILAAGFAGVVSTGAATFCFIKALERRGLKLSYEQLLVEMNYSCKEERECWRCWTGCWEGCACGAPRLLLVLHFLHFALLPQLKPASAVAVINCSRACCRWFNSYLLPASLFCSGQAVQGSGGGGGASRGDHERQLAVRPGRALRPVAQRLIEHLLMI